MAELGHKILDRIIIVSVYGQHLPDNWISNSITRLERKKRKKKKEKCSYWVFRNCAREVHFKSISIDWPKVLGNSPKSNCVPGLVHVLNIVHLLHLNCVACFCEVPTCHPYTSHVSDFDFVHVLTVYCIYLWSWYIHFADEYKTWAKRLSINLVNFLFVSGKWLSA